MGDESKPMVLNTEADLEKAPEPELWELSVFLEGGTYPLRLLFDGKAAADEAVAAIRHALWPPFTGEGIQMRVSAESVTLESDYGVLHVRTSAIQAFHLAQAGSAAPPSPPLANFSAEKPAPKPRRGQ